MKQVVLFFFGAAFLSLGLSASYSVRPLIGSGSKGDGGPANAALLDGPFGLAGDSVGNVYISEANAGVIRRVRPSGVIERYAGSGVIADGAQGQTALATDLLFPTVLSVDSQDRLLFADGQACRIRRVNTDGTITNLVGTGRCAGASSTFPGGGGGTVSDGPPLQTDIGSVGGMTFDNSGLLIFSDETNHVVRRLDADGVVRTIAGVGQGGYNGDSISATSAALNAPRGVAVDRDGNIYIADGLNCRLRVIDSTGTITTTMGSGTCATMSSGNNGSSLGIVTGLTYNAVTNSLVISSPGVARVLQLDISARVVSQVIGNGRIGATDTTAALSYNVNNPESVLFHGNQILVADYTAFHVLQIQNGIVASFAGMWPQLDVYPSPLTAPLLRPTGNCFTPKGSLIVLDTGAERVLSLSSSGQLTAFAGAKYPTGVTGGDGGLATTAQIANPRRVLCAPNGVVYLSQSNQIRAIDSQGKISTYLNYVKTSTTSSTGVTTTTTTSLSTPTGMVMDSSGRLLFSESGANRIVRYDPSAQTTTIIAGTGVAGFRGDGGLATNARLSAPADLAIDSKGNLIIADSGNGRIRRVTSDGNIQTIAGSALGFSYSDTSGQLATSIGLGSITGLALDASDNIYLSEVSRISMIGADGRIQILVGFVSQDNNGVKTYRIQPLNGCDSLAFDSSGRLYLSVTYDSRVVQFLAPGDAGPPPTILPGGVITSSAFGASSSIAPGSWVEIYGSNLASDTRSWAAADFQGAKAPTSLDATTVAIGGQGAFVSYISPSQINVQVPSNVATGAQQITVMTAAGISSSYSVTVNATQPCLFAPASFQLNGKQYAGAVFSDGATFVLPANAISGVASRPAHPGETITLYGIGFGPVTPAIDAGIVVAQPNTLASSLQILFGQAQANTTYAGLAPGAVGLYQFNVIVPAGVSGDAVPLSFSLSGSTGSQTLYTPVSP